MEVGLKRSTNDDNTNELLSSNDETIDNNDTEEMKSTTATETTTIAETANEISRNNDNNNLMSESTKSASSISPFNPTCLQAQETILRLFDLQSPDDVLFDLGCGDARLLQLAVQTSDNKKLRCVGIDIDATYMNRAIESITSNFTDEQQQRIRIRNESLLHQPEKRKYAPNCLQNKNNHEIENGSDKTASISTSSLRGNDDVGTSTIQNEEQQQQQKVTTTTTMNNNMIGSDCTNLTLFDDATAVYLFLLPKALIQVKDILDSLIDYRTKLRQQRQQPKEKFQVITYMFQIHGWEPCFTDRTTKANVPIYLYKFFI